MSPGIATAARAAGIATVGLALSVLIMRIAALYF